MLIVKLIQKVKIKFNKIKGYFNCSWNNLKTLKTLEGCPEIIEGDFYCEKNNLNIEELKYLPKLYK